MGLGFRNFWHIRHLDKDHNLLWEDTFPNLVVTEGLTNVLDVHFCSGTQITGWYILIFSSDSTPAAGWTYANIGTNFTEFTSYDESTRPEWGPSSPSTPTLLDSVEFTASTGADTTIYGAAMVSYSTKGDNSASGAVIWCASRFSSSRPFAETEVLQVAYTINATDV